MNKSELIDAISKSADISKASAGKALDGTLTVIKATLKKGQSVTLVGFGTFKVGKRAARTGRNPVLVQQLKSRQPRFQSSALARR